MNPSHMHQQPCSIQELVQFYSSQHEQLTKMHKKHLSLAAIRVLGINVEPYLQPQQPKKITAYQRKQILHEAKNLGMAKEKNRLRKAEKVKTSHTMIQGLRADPAFADLTKEGAVKSLFEDYYQISGCKISYAGWKEGDIIPGPHPELSDYNVHKIIKNKSGLQIICLVPTKQDGHSSPIVCCRGTTGDQNNWVDDMKKNIGLYGFSPSEEIISQTIKELANQYGPVVVTGHSLGGAVGQILTTKLFDPNGKTSLIKSLYLFSSPGASNAIKQEFLNKKTQASHLAPSVHYYYHTGDIVVLAGGGRVPATEKIKLGTYSFLSFLRAPIQTIRTAHSWKHRISEFRREKALESTHHMSTRYEKAIRAISEFFRFNIGVVIKRILAYQIQQKNAQKTKAKELQSRLFSN